jgi:hAT family C-terminal dimerisation region
MSYFRDSLCGRLPIVAHFVDPSRDRSRFDPHGKMVDVVRSVCCTEYSMEATVVFYEEHTSEQAYINVGTEQKEEGDDEARCLNMTNKSDEACTDVLHWWRTFGSEHFKYLARLARDVFVVMGSLVPSESAFSDSCQFVPPDRHSISEKNLERSMIIRSWNRVVGSLTRRAIQSTIVNRVTVGSLLGRLFALV